MAQDMEQENKVLKKLTSSMHQKPKMAVIKRYEAMVRELRYRVERQDKDLLFIRSKGWEDDRLYVLFALNSVYQEVLGPLQCSARSGISGVGTDHPIVHGGSRFDRAHTVRVNQAIAKYFTMTIRLGFQWEWLAKNTCNDLIYFVARQERQKNEEE